MRSSKSIMFVAPRYSTGLKFNSAARARTAATGLGHVRPVANHVSSSAIQKSVSTCAAIITSSDIMNSPSVFAFRPIATSVPIKSLFVDVCCGGGVSESFPVAGCSGTGLSSVVSKLISVNSGMADKGVVKSEAPSVSKSVGRGKSEAFSSIVRMSSAGADSGFVTADTSNADIAWRILSPRRMRINAWRSSVGISGGRGGSTAGFVSGAGGSGCAGGTGAGAGVGGGGTNARFIMLGMEMENRNFLFRIITVVVAMYIGMAARIKIPNTNPPNPCRCDDASFVHAAMENMLKLNSHVNIAHIMHT